MVNFSFILLYVSASVRRNRLVKRATRAEVKMTVKLWLRYAVDQTGGWKSRENKKQRTHRWAQESDVEIDWYKNFWLELHISIYSISNCPWI